MNSSIVFAVKNNVYVFRIKSTIARKILIKNQFVMQALKVERIESNAESSKGINLINNALAQQQQ